MMRTIRWIFVLVFCTWSSEVYSQNDEKFAKACNCFAVNLMKQLKTDDGNLIASTFGVDVVLSMLMMGAKTTTADQLNEVLQNKANGLTSAEVYPGFKSALSKLNATTDVILSIADSIWIDNNFTVKDEYKKMVEDTFLAQERVVSFSNNPHGATEEINQWVNDKTKSFITKLFDQDLDRSTIMVLLNAIYFKGQWFHKFDAAETKDREFYNGGDKNAKKMVPLMNQKNQFMYKDDSNLKARFLQMPYKGKQFYFIVALPNEGVSLEDFKNGLSCGTISQTLTMTETVKANVTLPRFNFSSDHDLKEPLMGLGLTSVFQNADLSGISDAKLQLSKIVQKARIKVDEEGSEAAAVTGGVVALAAAWHPEPKEVEFLVNRPFYYFIVDQSSGLILFQGRLNKL